MSPAEGTGPPTCQAPTPPRAPLCQGSRTPPLSARNSPDRGSSPRSSTALSLSPSSRPKKTRPTPSLYPSRSSGMAGAGPSFSHVRGTTTGREGSPWISSMFTSPPMSPANHRRPARPPATGPLMSRCSPGPTTSNSSLMTSGASQTICLPRPMTVMDRWPTMSPLRLR